MYKKATFAHRHTDRSRIMGNAPCSMHIWPDLAAGKCFACMQVDPERTLAVDSLRQKV